MNKVLKYISLTFYIFILLIIILKACESGEKSSKSSNEFTDAVIGVIDDINYQDESISDKYGLDNIRYFIRKAIGHFALFAIFAIAGVLVFFSFINNRSLRYTILFSSGLVVALISEAIQIFSSNRVPSFKDVCIDYCGYLFGTTISLLIIFVLKKSRKKVCSYE